MVEAIKKEMKSELEYKGMEREEEPTELEQYFLDKLDTIRLSDTEIHELIRPTDEKEIIDMLKMIGSMGKIRKIGIMLVKK